MFKNIPKITKNLIIINGLMFLATFVFQSAQGIDLIEILGAYYPASENFKFYQVLTHMFMHGGFAHFFFNMFALWMFGSPVERALGEKNYLTLYFVAGLGAFGLFNLTNYFEVNALIDSFGVTVEQVSQLRHLAPYNNTNTLTQIYTIPMVGASGAIFGVLAAFGMMFPNSILMLIFPPIPLKAKYFIPIYILIELYLAVANNPGDNVAHYAHLGGALIGFLLVRYWKKTQFNNKRWD